MARRIFGIWTYTLHARFQRALNNPEFKSRVLAQMKVSDTSLKNWLSQADVPATKRADVKDMLDEWERETATQPTIN